MGLSGMLRPLLYLLCSSPIIADEIRTKKLLIRAKDQNFLIKTKQWTDQNLQTNTESGIEYKDDLTAANNPSPPSIKNVGEGEDVSLKCESSEEFQNCKFKDPNGKMYTLLKPNAASYNSRVEFLQKDTEDQTKKVCGVNIQSTTKEDTGEWSCIMEFDKSGKIVVPMFLQVDEKSVNGTKKG